MSAAPDVALCITTTGERFARFREVLEAVLATIPRDAAELRFAFRQARTSFHYTLGTLIPDGVHADYTLLPEGIERYTWAAPGPRVWLWDVSHRAADDTLDRLLYHDVSLTAPYVVALTDDTLVAPGWWEALAPLRERRVDYAGRLAWLDYGPGQVEAIRAQPWYRGRPPESRNGRPGVAYANGGFLLVRADCLREADYPSTGVRPVGHPLDRLPRPALLGAVAHQLEWSQVHHDLHIRLPEDTP